MGVWIVIFSRLIKYHRETSCTCWYSCYILHECMSASASQMISRWKDPIETHHWVMVTERLPKHWLKESSFASVIHPWANRRGQINDHNYPESCDLHFFACFFSDISFQSLCHLSFYLGWFSVIVSYSLHDIKAALLIKDVTECVSLAANLPQPAVIALQHRGNVEGLC